MSRLPESNFWQTIKGALERHLRLIRIENATHAGTPDVYWRRGQRAGWLELKAVRSWPARPATPLHIRHFTGEQLSWLEAEVRAGGNAHLLLKVAETVLLLDVVVARELYLRRLTRADLEARAMVVSNKAFPGEAILGCLFGTVMKNSNVHR